MIHRLSPAPIWRAALAIAVVALASSMAGCAAATTGRVAPLPTPVADGPITIRPEEFVLVADDVSEADTDVHLYAPQVSGDRIVWQDDLIGLQTWTPSGGVVVLGNGSFAAVSGDRVVWLSHDLLDSAISLWTPEKGVTALDFDDAGPPAIHGDRISWEGMDGMHTAEVGGTPYSIDSETTMWGISPIPGDGAFIAWGTEDEVFAWSPEAGTQTISDDGGVDVTVAGGRISWASGDEIRTWTKELGYKVVDYSQETRAVAASENRIAWINAGQVMSWTPGVDEPVKLADATEGWSVTISEDTVSWSDQRGIWIWTQESGVLRVADGYDPVLSDTGRLIWKVEQPSAQSSDYTNYDRYDLYTWAP